MEKSKSEIRESEINELLEKVAKKSYDKYLMSIKIKNLRGFKDKQIDFDFPVTALIGPNGGGKTTILGAAGILHYKIKPRQFFVKNDACDTKSMSNWKIEYSIVNKETESKDLIIKSAFYGGHKWSRRSISRPIDVFGISRTVPPTEKIEYFKYMSNAAKNTKYFYNSFK